MDEELRKAERENDSEKVKRLRERAGQVPWRIWVPDKEGRAWVQSDGWGTFASLEDAENWLLSDGRRESASEEAYYIAWGYEVGYLAGARYAADMPEPLELLLEDEERFYDHQIDQRPTLHGGPPEFEDDRYDEIHE